MEFARTLLDSIKLVFLIVPRRPARRIGPEQFWLALLLFAIVFAYDSWTGSPAPRQFESSGLQGLAFVGLLALLVSYLAALALRRPVLFWPLATLLLTTQVAIDLLLRPVETFLLPLLPLSEDAQYDAARNLWIVLSVLAARRIFDYLEPYRLWPLKALAAVLVCGALLLPWWFVGTGTLFYPRLDSIAEIPPPKPVPDIPAFDADRVRAAQSRMVGNALAALAPQRPGVVDLYLVAFAGDGSEDVFRNEVEYVERLFEQRFQAEGRTLVLLNNPATVETRPLATRTNLRDALRGIGRHIDPAEDIVMLFLTSHGSEDHELYVGLEPLPLYQLKPRDVAGALRDAGIDWRVVVVSACYSGGFIPALADEHALVITASRADRTSFGCGVESDFTYFGRAFFIEALNRTPSLVEAFARADREIGARERAEDLDRSFPQIATSEAIERKLAAWLGGLAVGPAVPFEMPELSATQR